MTDARTESGLPMRAALRPRRRWRASTRRCSWAIPGEYPFTRGVYPSMYTGRPVDDAAVRRASAPPRSPTSATTSWSPRAPAACRSPSTCRRRWATTPTTRWSRGEVGKVGVAIDSIEDMRVLFGGLPLDQISTSMTINAPAAVLLLLYQLVAAEQGIDGSKLTGTIQNDVLKEYIARGTYIFPPKASLRLISDIFAYCRDELPALEHDLDLRLPHGRGRGDARAGDRLHAGRTPRSTSAPRRPPGSASTTSARGCRSSSWRGRRCSRRSRSSAPPAGSGRRIIRDEFGVDEPQVADAAVPHPDRGRAAHRPAARGQPGAGRAAGAGRGPRRHPVAAHELLRRGDRAARPQKAARLALRTQQVIAYETDVTKTVDPFAGSYVVESMTDALEAEILALIQAVEDRGGAVAAIEQGFQKEEIERSAYAIAQQIDDGERTIVGVNKYTIDERRAVRAAARRPDDRGPAARARSRRCAPGATTPPSRRRSTRCAPRPRAPTTCSTR